MYKRQVVGISGGLDSTLALLVTAKAFDALGLERSGITAAVSYTHLDVYKRQITRRSLMYVAEHYLRLEVEEREVYLDEVKDFAECGLCGTAAVISPVGKIVDHGKEICFPSGMEEMGPVTKKLYETLTGIQMGHIEAPEGWICKIC